MNKKIVIGDKEYTLLKILAPKDSDDRYIIHTDNSGDYYASKYTCENDEIILHNITEEYEWDYVDERMKEILYGE